VSEKGLAPYAHGKGRSADPLTRMVHRLDNPRTSSAQVRVGRCSAMDVAAELRRSISRICDVPAETISDESTLSDLGFDSLAAAEVLTDVEIRLGRELPVDGLRRLTQARTVGDVVRVLEDQLTRPGG